MNQKEIKKILEGKEWMPKGGGNPIKLPDIHLRGRGGERDIFKELIAMKKEEKKQEGKKGF